MFEMVQRERAQMFDPVAEKDDPKPSQPMLMMHNGCQFNVTLNIYVHTLHIILRELDTCCFMSSIKSQLDTDIC